LVSFLHLRNHEREKCTCTSAINYFF
jgi:hypothetical protein